MNDRSNGAWSVYREEIYEGDSADTLKAKLTKREMSESKAQEILEIQLEKARNPVKIWSKLKIA